MKIYHTLTEENHYIDLAWTIADELNAGNYNNCNLYIIKNRSDGYEIMIYMEWLLEEQPEKTISLKQLLGENEYNKLSMSNNRTDVSDIVEKIKNFLGAGR